MFGAIALFETPGVRKVRSGHAPTMGILSRTLRGLGRSWLLSIEHAGLERLRQDATTELIREGRNTTWQE